MIHHTTLSELRKHNCSFLDKLVSALGPDWGENTPIPLTKIIETNGIKDAIWALRANLHPDAEKESRLFACDMAERVLPLFEKQFPLDERPRKAIEISRLFAEGKATKEELGKARDDAAHAAAYHASYAAANNAAHDAAHDAADAANHAAHDAAAEREEQKKLFLKRFGTQVVSSDGMETIYVSVTKHINDLTKEELIILLGQKNKEIKELRLNQKS